MSGDKRSRLKQWLESGEARLHPLTLPQRELWEASPVPPSHPANHICCLIQIRGPITPQDCEAAIQRVVDRQEVLRLSILPGKDRPLQMVREKREVNFHFRELSASESQPEAIEEIAREVFRAPFDWVQGPLYRVGLLRRAPSEYVLAFAIHHAIADGWSLGVFVRDLATAYAQGIMGLRNGQDPEPLSYTAWDAAERAAWQPAKLEACASFWKSQLSGARPLWESPSTAGTTPALPTRVVTHLEPGPSRALRELARSNGVTLYSTLLAAFQIALSRWKGVTDIVVGTPVANRGRQAVRETMGYCAGIVPVRGQVEMGRPFTESLQAVQEAATDAFANAMPFAELARALGEFAAPGRNPIFQVRFALQNHPVPDVDLPQLSAHLEMRSTGTARFDLACEITELGERLEVVWLFRPDLFSHADVETLRNLYEKVLEGVCRSPASRAAALAI
jgi:hypothetical protein